MTQTYNIYVGYDPKEEIAYEILKWNLERIAKNPVNVFPFRKDILEKIGMYNREYTDIKGQKIDRIDGKPFSSDFSFSRFLVPALNMYQGWALYMDCDMYPRSDICELFEEYNDPFHPLYCVKHEYIPENSMKRSRQRMFTLLLVVLGFITGNVNEKWMVSMQQSGTMMPFTFKQLVYLKMKYINIFYKE